MTIDIMVLLETRGMLEDIRTALTPDTLNGITEAQQAREYIFDVIDEMKKWEGEEIDRARITLACRKLDKARDFIGPYDEEIDAKIFEALKTLEALEDEAKEEKFMMFPEEEPVSNLIGVIFDGGGKAMLSMAPGSVPPDAITGDIPGKVKIDINGNVTTGEIVDITDIPAASFREALDHNLPF